MNLILVFLLSAIVAYGEISFGTASRIRRGAGAPSSGDCAVASDVGKVYIQNDLAASGSPIFACSNSGSGTYSWQQASGGGGGGGSNLTTVNAVPYVSASGVLNQDASNFYWDATNHRLGIGTNAPSVALHVAGEALIGSLRINGSGTSNLSQSGGSVYLDTSGSFAGGWHIRNSSFTTLLRILNSGSVGIGTSNTAPTGTLSVLDRTATTGATSLLVGSDGTNTSATTTQVVVKAGAGQSSTNLQEWQNSSGTVLSGFAPSGDLFFTSSTSASDVRISRVAVGIATAMAAILRGDSGDYGRLYLKSIQAQATTGIAGLIGWGTTPGTYTTALSEISAGIVGVGTGAAGSTAGKLKLTEVIWVTGTESTCDFSSRGRVVMTQGSTGVADTFRVCAKNAADSYVWTALF